MNSDFELRLCTICTISKLRPGLTPGTALRAVGSGTSITEISVNDNSITDSKLIAEAFNEYFVNIGPSLASEASENLLTEHKTGYSNSYPIVRTILHFHHININDIVLALTNFKVNKSTDLDKIPANVLRVSAGIIAPYLTYIFNLSLDTGVR